jgi:Skp family chaperone for outer membrane proteins
MFHTIRWGRLAVLAMFVLLAGGAALAAPSSSIGVIDLDAVARGYIGYEDAQARLTAFSNERQKLFFDYREGFGLSSEEFDEYQQLVKSGITTDRRTALKELSQKNLTRYQELTDFQKERELTEEEQTELTKLEANGQDVAKKLNDHEKKLTGEIEVEYARITEIMTGFMDKAIAKVSGDKKLGIVLNKNVQMNDGTEKLVLWGGTDITDDVIKKLNADFPKDKAELDKKP